MTQDGLPNFWLWALLKGASYLLGYIRELRDQTRRMSSTKRQRLLYVLGASNIILDNVASNVFGVSGMAMLNALISNESEKKDIVSIADLDKRKPHEKIPDIIEAFNGELDSHHKELIEDILKHLELLDTQIGMIEQIIDQKCEP